MTTQLDGLCILNTRPHDEASLLTQQIQDAGGVVIALPTLEIKCPTTPPILPDLTTIDHAIFVSPHAVSHFFKTFSPLYWPSSIKLFALGEGTKKKLLSYQITTPVIPEESHSEAFLTIQCLQHVVGKKILLVKGEGGRPLINDTLTQRGAFVFPMDVYRRTCPKSNPKRINKLWQENTIDIILVTSYEGMINLMTLFNQHQTWLLNKPWIVLSDRLALLAKQHGATQVIVSRTNQIIHTLTHFKETVAWSKMKQSQQKTPPPNNQLLS